VAGAELNRLGLTTRKGNFWVVPWAVLCAAKALPGVWEQFGALQE